MKGFPFENLDAYWMSKQINSRLGMTNVFGIQHLPPRIV